MPEITSFSPATNAAPAFDLAAWSKSGRKLVLNAGSGDPSHARLHSAFAPLEWTQIRFDADPRVGPDIVGDIATLGRSVPPGCLDAIWCSHMLEHVSTHQVVPTLAQFRQALRDDGFVLLTCPDLTAIARLIVEGGATATAYVSAAGPITPIDMLFGHTRSIAEGNGYMAHKTGFTASILGAVAIQAGFAQARVSVGNAMDLWALFAMPGTDYARVAAMLAATPEAFLVPT